MPRPAKVTQPVRKEIRLAPDLFDRVDFILFSPAEQRVPYDAWNKLVTRLLEEFVKTTGA